MKTSRVMALAAICICLCLTASAAAAKTPSIQSDVSALYSRDASTRTQALNNLRATGPSASPLLLKVLCNTNAQNFDLAWPLAAELLSDWKVADASRCLVPLLMYDYPSIGPVVMKSDQTLSEVDPAFAALVKIGEPAVPAIQRRLPFLGPEPALMALRVLRKINTESAKEAAEAYVRVLETQTRLAKEVLEDFGKK